MSKSQSRVSTSTCAVIAAVSLLIYEFLLRDFIMLQYLNYSIKGSFAPASPHKASRGTDLGISSQDLIKVIDAKYFKELIESSITSKRKRKMTDLTKDPEMNSMQVLMNTWTSDSFSPVHKHPIYSEAFVVLEGALAFFVFNEDGGQPTCHILSTGDVSTKRAIIVEANQWHAMAVAPKRLGYEGTAVIFEISGHQYSTNAKTKQLAPFAPSANEGLDGDAAAFDKLYDLCPKNPK